jgi:hypothetical protein
VIGPLDLLITGTALSRGAVLVTNNTKEFSWVKGLRLADWTRLAYAQPSPEQTEGCESRAKQQGSEAGSGVAVAPKVNAKFDAPGFTPFVVSTRHRTNSAVMPGMLVVVRNWAADVALPGANPLTVTDPTILLNKASVAKTYSNDVTKSNVPPTNPPLLPPLVTRSVYAID